MHEKKTLDTPTEEQFSDKLGTLISKFKTQDEAPLGGQAVHSYSQSEIAEITERVAKAPNILTVSNVLNATLSVTETKKFSGLLIFSVPCNLSSMKFENLVSAIKKINPAIESLEKAGYAAIFLPSSPDSAATSSMIPMP